MNSEFVFSQIKTNDKYEYPIKPGTEEWWKFETVEKRVEALQIPNEILTKISTEGLLDTCLEYPFLLSILSGNNCQHGFEGLVMQFNGFCELFKRSNIIDALLKKYEHLSLEIPDIQLKEDLERGMFSYRHFVLEYILAQDFVLKSLNLEQEKKLFLLSLEHKKKKQNYMDIFSELNYLPTYFLYAKKILNEAEFKFDNIEQKNILIKFVQGPVAIDKQMVGYLEDYINNKYK
jgi:hypothetical protein